MRRIMLATAACCFYAAGLLAQSKTDSALIEKQELELKQALADADRKLEERQKLYQEVQNKKVKYDTIGLAQYRFEMAQLKQERRLQAIEFVKAHPDYKVSVDALKDVVGHLPDNIVAYNKLFNRLSKSVRKSKEGLELKKSIDGFMAVRTGAKAPLFSSTDTAGHAVDLKGFRGKYVLIDFWASWCYPCRDENPNLVKAFEKYKNRNFTVLGVSLDQPGKHDAWTKAIKDDGLTWQHVSDLKYWKNEVALLYSVRSIPQNFLLDPKGKIIAANLRGEELHRKLQELLPH
ncbi:peroxiredoxin family protein [Pseudobacter ginsenosidimutans]|uniref:Peroxiredoxin n=1 Tax=Pseudobacter ginsenosidimutans TaxID=661488 RepID=A0A4Q7N473_9BACT|nr:TlpA disulfide reductase family protein [Pseudobacter ginsenosidimutans]QEC44326.1 redoxin domain-containing protein [Pseudobacter ginsenosidimutans]RZS75788.1 peroxiredoxin [Pseudobacter ginsenosidimutans]